MGGDAGASSQPGVGSTFWFSVRLPRAPATAPLPDAPADASWGEAERRLRLELPGRRVLLAEDDPINREVAIALLELAGQQVDVAVDGEQAVAKVATQRYDLVLMDMQMPRLDGLQAARRIRALPGAATLPIVALTANAFAEDRERCLAAGMNDFVAKPLDMGELYAVLLRWMK
jgi:CheY-like chemotaxis protein